MLPFSPNVVGAVSGLLASLAGPSAGEVRPGSTVRGDVAGTADQRGADDAGTARHDLTNEYDLHVRLDPGTGVLSASGTMTIVADAPTTHVDLLLNKALRVADLSCIPACRMEVLQDATIGGAVLVRTQRLRLTPSSALAIGDRLRISFRYAGTIRDADIEVGRGIITPAWSELSLGALWYPVWFDEPMVRSRVTVRLPEGYQFTAPGQVSRLPSGEWRAVVESPGITRVSFAAAKGWAVQERPIDRGRTALLYTPVPEPRGDAILAAVSDAYGFYRSVLGRPKGIETDLRVLYANQVGGLKYPREAYATGGSFIVLDESRPEVQRDTIHHEVAHLWFSAGRPGTPDEFLSESVAEYLAMRQGERVWGAEWIADKRRATAERSARVRGSLLAIDGFTATRQSLLYDRGPTALWSLHDRIGGQEMDRLLERVHASSTSTLAKFMEILASEQGSTTADWFRSRL